MRSWTRKWRIDANANRRWLLTGFHLSKVFHGIFLQWFVLIGTYIYLDDSMVMERNRFFYANYIEKVFQGMFVQFFVRTKLGKANRQPTYESDCRILQDSRKRSPTVLGAPITEIIQPIDLVAEPFVDRCDELTEECRAKMSSMKRLSNIRWAREWSWSTSSLIEQFVIPEFDDHFFLFSLHKWLFGNFRPFRLFPPIIKIPRVSLGIVEWRRTKQRYQIMESSLVDTKILSNTSIKPDWTQRVRMSIEELVYAKLRVRLGSLVDRLLPWTNEQQT